MMGPVSGLEERTQNGLNVNVEVTWESNINKKIKAAKDDYVLRCIV